MLASQQQVQICICERPRKESVQLQMTASVAASIISVMATNPLDVIKTRIQTGTFKQRILSVRDQFNTSAAITSNDYLSKPSHVLKAILKDEGVRGLWRGTGAGIAHALPSISIYLTCYEQMKSWLDQEMNINPELSPPIAGGISRFYAVVLTCPLEVVRTRLMASSRIPDLAENQRLANHRPTTSTVSVLRQLALENGFRSLWKGMTPMLWRDVPFSAIYWSLAEATRNFLMVQYCKH